MFRALCGLCVYPSKVPGRPQELGSHCLGCLQEQKAAVAKSTKAMLEKEKELQKALKDAKVHPFKRLNSYC